VQIHCVAGGDGVIRINEFSVGVEGALGDEFVEIANTGTAASDLAGWKLVYRSGAGTSDVSLGTLADGTTLAPGAFFLFGGSGYAGAHPADKSFSAGLASAAGGVAIKDADGNIVDSVGWGDATNAFVEGATAAAPPIAPAPGKSDGRHPNGHDTNVNSADFTIGDPTPGSSN
jgi:Lamin Tail Domain